MKYSRSTLGRLSRAKRSPLPIFFGRRFLSASPRTCQSCMKAWARARSSLKHSRSGASLRAAMQPCNLALVRVAELSPSTRYEAMDELVPSYACRVKGRAATWQKVLTDSYPELGAAGHKVEQVCWRG